MPDEEKGGQGTDPTQAFQRRLEKFEGDALKFATALFDENWQLREKNRTLEGKAPSEGAVVLSKADAERWEKYRALGKPEEFESLKEEKGTLAEENASLKRDQILREVADEMGWKFSVLKDRDTAAGGKVEYLSKQEDGKAVRYAKTPEGEVKLAEFAEKNWGDYLPSLTKPEQRQEGFATQGGGVKPPPKDVFSRVREQEQETAKKQTEDVHAFFKDLPGRASAA